MQWCIVEVMPVKKSKSDKKLKYFSRQKSDGMKSLRVVSQLRNAMCKSLEKKTCESHELSRAHARGGGTDDVLISVAGEGAGDMKHALLSTGMFI